mmetsp:Transcript_38487/g.106052  ORF Transcript_38487/g.106052 Transcript_38487/m.106052 type:complete len:203 (-) Transcript_38487:894-1502(-)
MISCAPTPRGVRSCIGVAKSPVMHMPKPQLKVQWAPGPLAREPRLGTWLEFFAECLEALCAKSSSCDPFQHVVDASGGAAFAMAIAIENEVTVKALGHGGARRLRPGARIDRTSDGYHVGGDPRSSHLRQPLHSAVRVPRTRQCLQHSVVRNHVWRDGNLDHLSQPIYCRLVVSGLGASVHDAVVHNVVRINSIQSHLAEPL